MVHILLTNDDGIHAAGLRALAEKVKGFAVIKD
jgi:broad specificity polyphosphatase/5'/3'-nucleotidase SurE